MSHPDKTLKDELAKLTTRLVSFRTVSDNTTELNKCFDYIEKYFQDRQSLRIKRLKYNDQPILILTNTPSKNPDIILSGHIDVVAGSPSQFKPERRNNRLYGRGALDMKGGVAVLLKVFHDLTSSNLTNLPSIALHLTSDEETGAKSSVFLAEKEKWRAKFMLVPEGAPKFQLVSREKAVCWIKIKATGKSSHAAYPWLGDNAATKLWQAYNKIIQLFPPPKDTWIPTVSLSKFKTDETNARNQVPATAEALLDIRYTNAFADSARQVLEKLQKKAPEVSLTLEDQSNLLFVPDNNKYLVQLLKIASTIKKRKVKPGFNHGASDAAAFATVGVPVVTSGVTGANHHADNEYVSLSSLVDYYHIVRRFIENFESP
jgi:succinyl-diaminopimelate desuccinylase